MLAAVLAASAFALSACEHCSAPTQGNGPTASTDTGSFLDNGDGSVIDPTTGLVWEKKCNCPDSLHHYETPYHWSGDGERETIWDWLDSINTEGIHGFTGHNDWRIPNVKELVSLVDYERTDPAIAPVFDLCETPCSEPAAPRCGCTASGPYWTSTTFADFPAHALVVGFASGNVDDQLKTLRGLVRAVRGPVAPGARSLSGLAASSDPTRPPEASGVRAGSVP